MMKLVFFARIRETVGQESMALDLPAGVATVGQLLDHLGGQDRRFADAFADRTAVRVAVDQQHGDENTSIAAASEIAFFPPMTGG